MGVTVWVVTSFGITCTENLNFEFANSKEAISMYRRMIFRGKYRKRESEDHSIWK
jgi:hypothetical protein